MIGNRKRTGIPAACLAAAPMFAMLFAPTLAVAQGDVQVRAAAEFDPEEGVRTLGASSAPVEGTRSGTIVMYVDPESGRGRVSMSRVINGRVFADGQKISLDAEETEALRAYLDRSDTEVQKDGVAVIATQAATDGERQYTRGEAVAPANHFTYQFTYAYNYETQIAAVSYSRSSRVDTVAETLPVLIPRDDFSAARLMDDYFALLEARGEGILPPPLYTAPDDRGARDNFFRHPEFYRQKGYYWQRVRYRNGAVVIRWYRNGYRGWYAEAGQWYKWNNRTGGYYTWPPEPEPEPEPESDSESE